MCPCDSASIAMQCEPLAFFCSNQTVSLGRACLLPEAWMIMTTQVMRNNNITEACVHEVDKPSPPEPCSSSSIATKTCALSSA